MRPTSPGGTNAASNSPVVPLLRRRFERNHASSPFHGGGRRRCRGLVLSPRSRSPTRSRRSPMISVPNPLRLPADIYFGEVSGVALNSKGMSSRSRAGHDGARLRRRGDSAARNRRRRRFLRDIGHNLYAWSFAHTVKVDRNDNIWVTDKGSDMVVKFTPDGRVDMVFGRKQEASDEGTGPPETSGPAAAGRKRQVSSGDRRRLGRRGQYLHQRRLYQLARRQGGQGWELAEVMGRSRLGPGQFHTPHSIAVDASGQVYVADRGNRRIQVFDGDGKFLRQFTIDVPVPPDAQPAIGNKPGEAEIAAGTFAPGSPWAICISPGPKPVLYSADAFPGRIYRLTLDGKLLGLLGQSGKRLKQFGWIHQMACPAENVLYVAELLNWRVQKLVLHG